MGPRPWPIRLLVHDGNMTVMAARLLVLEDDDGLRTSLRLVLEAGGYEVVEAADAERALEAVADPGVDLMLVDLMLRGMDGFTFIQRARPQTDAPIVVMSARDGVQDIVHALEVGADDYVTKPFDVEEVQARLRALLRRPTMDTDLTGRGDASADRSQTCSSWTANAGPWSSTGARHSWPGEREIHLTITEFRLLSVLVDNPGRVLESRLAPRACVGARVLRR